LINYFTVTHAISLRLIDADVAIKLLTWIKIRLLKALGCQNTTFNGHK